MISSQIGPIYQRYTELKFIVKQLDWQGRYRFLDLESAATDRSCSETAAQSPLLANSENVRNVIRHCLEFADRYGVRPSWIGWQRV